MQESEHGKSGTLLCVLGAVDCTTPCGWVGLLWTCWMQTLGTAHARFWWPCFGIVVPLASKCIQYKGTMSWCTVPPHSSSLSWLHVSRRGVTAVLSVHVNFSDGKCHLLAQRPLLGHIAGVCLEPSTCMPSEASSGCFAKLHALPHTHDSLSMCAVQGQDNAKDLAGLETTDESEDEVSHVDSRRREILQASEQASCQISAVRML